MTFAKRVFLGAGIYGLVCMSPMYFGELAFNAAGQPLTHPESYYGFVGITLVFQLVFLVISRDPARYRPLMIVGVFEKLSFALAVWPLFLMGRSPAVVAGFGTIDLMLAVLFVISYLKTKPQA